MPEVLRWQAASVDAARVHEEYVLLLGDRLRAILATTHDEPLTASVKQALSSLPRAAWMRFVTAPQVSYRLLWPSRHEGAPTLQFLAAALLVELAGNRPGDVPAKALPGRDALWSVLGDGWLDGDGEFVAGPALSAFPPMDAGSPHALAIDLEGLTDEVRDARAPYDSGQVGRLLRELAGVRDALAANLPDVLEFVTTFTKVLVLQPDPDAPSAFSTGSSAQYVGRSVFGNPHLVSVDAALLAEGLVHEAIHSYLYMSERLEPWVTDPELYGPEHRTRSPWTGHPLPLRSYLQACFVWYGLLNLWARAVSGGAFAAGRCRDRLTQAARGFLTGGVLDQIEPFRAGITPELFEVIGQIEDEVVTAAKAVSVAD
jgi:HEXXH motif-containing protein